MRKGSPPSSSAQAVAARAKLPCADCALCGSGRGHLCRSGPIIGFQLPGCFSERALLPEIALVRVDDRISDSEAACLQSLSDSVAAVETAGIAIGDCVAVFGQGSMGLECLQVARASGAGTYLERHGRRGGTAGSKGRSRKDRANSSAWPASRWKPRSALAKKPPARSALPIRPAGSTSSR